MLYWKESPYQDPGSSTVFKVFAGSKVIRQSCVDLLWLPRNRMSELDTYGSVGVLSGNWPFYPDTSWYFNFCLIPKLLFVDGFLKTVEC